MSSRVDHRLSLSGSSSNSTPNRRHSSIHSRNHDAHSRVSDYSGAGFVCSNTASPQTPDLNRTNYEELMRMAEELNWGIQRLPTESPRAPQHPRSNVDLNVRRRTDQSQGLDETIAAIRTRYEELRWQSPASSNSSRSQQRDTSRSSSSTTTSVMGLSRIPQVRFNSVVIPRFGTAFQIISVSRSGHSNVVPLALSPDSRKFYALFAEDDVDFRIQVDNTACADRDAQVRLNVHDRENKRTFRNAILSNMTTFRGGKFHFVRQSGEEGQSNIGLLAAERGLTYLAAADVISKIGFKVGYSTPGYRIFVLTLDNITYEVVVHTTDTVELIKKKIEYQQGIPADQQRLIFSGVQLDDRKTAAESHIQQDSTLRLVLRVRGGASPRDCSTANMGIFQTNNLWREINQVDIGEPGAVVFGERIERNRRVLQTRSAFSLDHSVQTEDFTIELRLAPNYRTL